jgi:hypothetical protein
MSKWRDFEKLVARIYATISSDAVVTYDDKIHGFDSGMDRQIDVSVRFSKAGCDLLIIIQAKDYKNPCPITEVEAFATVIKDVRASKGVLICNAGFTDGARRVATAHGIDLCSAHSAEEKNWSTLLTVPVVWVRLSPQVFVVIGANVIAGDSFSPRAEEWVFSTDGGASRFRLIDRFVEAWNNQSITKEPGPVHEFDIGSNSLWFLADAGWRVVLKFGCHYKVAKDVFRKDVETEEFTGLKNYLSGKVEIAKIGVPIPPLNPNDGWERIDEGIEDLISRETVVVTVGTPVLHAGNCIPG